MKRGFKSALLVACAAHALAYAAGEGWMAWRGRADGSVDIDLSRSSLLPPPLFGSARRPAPPPPGWYVGERVKLAPRPVPPPHPPVRAAAVEEAAAASPPCPPPCPNTPGDWASAAQAMRKPQWLDGMITEDDYPEEARTRDITGLVVVEVLLDTQGAVRDVRLLRGADPLLNARTLEKVRAARFSPCLDGGGRPFPCRLRLPINWTLE